MTFCFAAIIGGGIGGTATGHFLRKALGDETAITIFEPENIGGRVKTIKMAGKEYECGGTMIHPANEIMTSLVEEMGLSKKVIHF